MKTKHLIPLLSVGIHRDITTTVHVQVAEHEILILQAVHGDSNVYPGEPTGAMTELDPATEPDRLMRKYGEDKVREAYGATFKGDIRRAPLASDTDAVRLLFGEGDGLAVDGRHGHRRLAQGQALDGLAQRGAVGAGLGPQGQVGGARVAGQALVVGLVQRHGAALAGIVAPHACYKKRSCLRLLHKALRPF